MPTDDSTPARCRQRAAVFNSIFSHGAGRLLPSAYMLTPAFDRRIKAVLAAYASPISTTNLSSMFNGASKRGISVACQQPIAATSAANAGSILSFPSCAATRHRRASNARRQR